MKEKINLFFTHKFLPIISIFMLCLFLLCTSCFSNNENTFVFHDDFLGCDINFKLPYDFGNEYKYYLLTCTNTTFDDGIKQTRYDIYYSKEPFVCTISSRTCYICPEGNTYCKSFDAINSNKLKTTLDFSSTSVSKNTLSVSNGRYIATTNFPNGMCLSNCNIIDKDTGEVVFQVAPVTVEQVTIPAIQQVGEIPQAMKEILKILIPVGLVIFGTGLLSFLIRYLSSRLM
ncbi:MAG: hypothetical protein HFJ40_05485 [Clostridia bacterium]|nr:hypothetical protein [Clostridia bacterium]